jgi:hypothetical protein
MQLIDNAQHLLKMTSVQLAGVTGMLAIAEQVLPQLQGVIPPSAYAVLSVLVIVARAVKQPRLTP